MTIFHEFCNELNVPITVDNRGMYTGMCKALCLMVNDVILSDDEEIFSLPWEDQKKMIKEKFYSVFPYMEN